MCIEFSQKDRALIGFNLQHGTTNFFHEFQVQLTLGCMPVLNTSNGPTTLSQHAHPSS